MSKVEEKSMVPTILIGIGGTGYEVLSRVRRLVEETYGSLKNFPIIGFLAIDTDRDYKVSDPLSAGSPFKDNEKHWAKVTGREAEEIITNMSAYPWIDRWFPRELERNVAALEAGAGQIRACGRFAFFCNYHAIQEKFAGVSNRIKGHENFMLQRYDIKVSSTAINVFVTGSLSGGTGSGMILDIGYCVRHWLRSQQSPLVTAIVPMPTAFASIKVGDRVISNGYAALMEMSYFSDNRTEYLERFSASGMDEVREQRPPFDFTYLVGTKNGEGDFKLDQIREMIAQNIFLDLASDFAPHKRSIRDNIKGSWASQDPMGRGYPKNFMSFGLSAIEIPITLIRTTLAYRLAKDFINWWLNESVQLPPQIFELTQNDSLKSIRLTEAELLVDLSSAGDRSYEAEIAAWIGGIRNEIAQDNLLECKQQGPTGLFRSETGKILKFVDYLQEKVGDYRANNLRDQSTDERLHGAFLQKMYDNRNKLIRMGRKALEQEFYQILEDRTKGFKFADAYLTAVRQVFNNAKEKFRRDSEKTWEPQIASHQQVYDKAINDITAQKTQFGLSKQDEMGKYAEAALKGIQNSFVAIIRLKARVLGLEVINRMEEHLNELEGRFIRLNQKLVQMRDFFKTKSDDQADRADALAINGIKLFDRQELNSLYQDLIEKYAGASEGSKAIYEIGMEQTCINLSENTLKDASPLWKETRNADEFMRLYDISNISDVQEEDFLDIIFNKAENKIKDAPNSTKLNQELAACSRVFKEYKNNESDIRNNLRLAFNRSKPLVMLDKPIMIQANFTPALNMTMAIVGGKNTSDSAALKLIPLSREFIGSEDSITPLGDLERHRIIFVQEIGGFSLRCISEMKDLRRNYQDWKGETILAKRARLRGESKDAPIPVHIQKEPPFWDIFPEDPEIFRLVIQARALEILRLEQNKGIKENVIRYTRLTPLGSENVDIASNWEEVVQVLEIQACRPDKEEIQKQVKSFLDKAETDSQKQEIFNQLKVYLDKRKQDLQKDGGEDNLFYKREFTIVIDLINTYKLKTAPDEIEAPPLRSLTEVKPMEVIVATLEKTDTLPVSEDPIQKLKQMKELVELGVISPEEFQAAKKKFLGL